MANSYFRFKQFTINQEKCAMKVGTDGCLLGAWVDLSSSQRILDVGCGSGLIAIMAAQRCPTATITGIEIDNEAASQAAENAESSPWAERIKIICKDFLKFCPEETFDTIVSNPPYFNNSLKCPNEKRNKARHDDSLPCNEFLTHANRLLSPNGTLSVIIPTDQQETWLTEAEECGYKAKRITRVHTRKELAAKRVLIEFRKSTAEECRTDDFNLEETPGVFSAEATEMLSPFYLKL